MYVRGVVTSRTQQPNDVAVYTNDRCLDAAAGAIAEKLRDCAEGKELGKEGRDNEGQERKDNLAEEILWNVAWINRSKRSKFD